MDKLSIAFAAVGIWMALGLVFLSMCKAASHADQEMENAQHRQGGPRTLKQHVFALHVRSVRSMRRLGGGHRSAPARVAVRDLAHPRHLAHSGLKPAHSA